MKKLFALILAVVMAMSTMVLASAEEAPAAAEAWLLYFASNHEKDSANFPWWPQHQRVDQPASETGVEYTNAMVTGPGKYTVGLKFNWQKAEGAIQFNLIINNAEVLFPGYYVDVTDIRVNGESIAINENYYGTYHDDTASGMVPLYNSYWDPFFTPDAVGPQNYRSFDGTPEDATHMVINPDDIVNGDTIEVDFVFAETAGATPEELGKKPFASVTLDEPEVEEAPETLTTAWLYLYDENYWPQNTGIVPNGNTITQNAEITGPGYYNVSAQFKWADYDPANNAVNGLLNMWLIFEDGGNVMPSWQYRVNVTDVKVNGQSIALSGQNGYGQIYWDHWEGAFQSTDSYAPIFDGSAMSSHLVTWNDAADGTAQMVNTADFKDVAQIDISFFVTNEIGVAPAQPGTIEAVWFPRNTVGVAGLSLKDLGIADDWHNIVPVDVSKTGWHVYTLVGADAHIIGNAYVAVNNGAITVDVEYAGGPGAMIIEESQCIKWFTSLDEITAEALTSTEDGIACGEPISLDADIAYLSINNKVTWRSPINNDGATLPRYWRNSVPWQNYRESLKTLLPAE